MNWIESLNQLKIPIGILVAFYGIDSWRREHKGRRQIELAEDTLALFYEAVDVIKYMRHPASFPCETEDVKRLEQESDQEYRARKNASIVFKRYNDHQDLFNKIHAMRYRFMAQIGKEKAKPFDDLRNIVCEIASSARMLSSLWARDYFRTEEQREKHWEKIKKYEAIFWESMLGEDPINPKLEALISDIEKPCQGVIEGKGTLFSILNKRLGK